MKFLKQKISPILAFVFVLVFGYFSIFLMNTVFNSYSQDELLGRLARLKAGQTGEGN